MKKAITLLAAATLTIGAAAQSLYPGQNADKVKIATAIPLKAKAFDLDAVRVLPGRVHDNIRRDSAWMANVSARRMLHSFRNNAGVFAGLEGGYEAVKKYGGWESLDCDLRGHTTGHLMSAYGLMFAATGDSLFKHKGDSLVAGLAEVQAALGPTGYVSAFPEQLINRNLKGQGVWAPWYTLHKIMSGLIDQYLYADNGQALDVAVKMGDWAYDKLHQQPEETRRLMLRNEFGGMNEAFYNLYAVTGDKRYKEMGDYFYHDAVLDPLKDGDYDMGTKHTNTFIPKLIGLTRKYELTGDTLSARMARDFWHTMTDHHCFATGECSQKEHFFDPAKMSKFLNGYTGETCCTYNMLKLSKHLFCQSADPAVADYYERALYNHILSQQDTETGMVCYFLPLLSGAHKVYSTPEQSFWCCVGSGFESHAKYAESIYFHGDNELFVNLFIPSRLDWAAKGLKLRQDTDFPSGETSTFHIENAPNQDLTLSLRYPEWSGKPIVKVNGKKVTVKGKPSSYIKLKRRWKAGDTVEVTYPMGLHLEATPDDASRAALMYGPIVLAGDLGTEGMVAPAPFSDPTVRNDYYTYDYNIPEGLNTSLDKDLSKIRRTGKGLEFETPDGRVIRPLYDTNHTRYVVYWDLK